MEKKTAGEAFVGRPAMTWTEKSLSRLNELVKKKFVVIRGSILRRPDDVREETNLIERAWHNYCMSVGIKMNIIPDHDTEVRPELPPPGEAMFLPDGTIRIRNAWGDKFIDMPEEFAAKAVVLGSLP